MADKAPTHTEPGLELTPRQRITRAAVGVLFYLILLIPRVRRLRRRVRLWTVIRIGSALAGMGLIWLFFHGRSAGFIVGGILFILLGLLVRATPVQKSLDDRARELGALVVLNGGMMILFGEPPCPVNIFANDERLTIENGARTVAEIPLERVQCCLVRALEPGEGKPWELEIAWGSPHPKTAKFRFEGFFAEHLARVAETAIKNLRQKDLAVLRL